MEQRMMLCLGRREALIGWWWVQEALANLVYDLTVKAAAGRGKGCWVGGRVSKGDILNLTGLSDDHLQSSILLSNYGYQQILLLSSIPITCGTVPLQHDGIRAAVLISGQTWIRKRYFCFINVIKCFVKCDVSIKSKSKIVFVFTETSIKKRWKKQKQINAPSSWIVQSVLKRHVQFRLIALLIARVHGRVSFLS